MGELKKEMYSFLKRVKMKEIKGGTLITYKVIHIHEWQAVGNQLADEGRQVVLAQAFVRKVEKYKQKPEHGIKTRKKKKRIQIRGRCLVAKLCPTLLQASGL